MKSTTMQENQSIFVLEKKIIELLKIEAKLSPLKRARICLHANHECPVQEMIIALRKDSIIEPHRHPPHKPESYHLIEGELNVNIFDSSGRRTQTVHLRVNSAVMYRISGNVWHQPESVSDCSVYHEVYSGPFEKLHDVHYQDWTTNAIPL